MKSDTGRSNGSWGAAWRPAGILYFLTLLAGLAAGIWPQWIIPSLTESMAAPRCALQTLAVSQVLFLLIVQPIVVIHRADHGRIGRYGRAAVAEAAGYLVVSAPAYLVAAFLSDAVFGDAVRSLVYVAAVGLLPGAAGAVLAARRCGRWVLLLGLQIVALGMPVAQYIALEFVPGTNLGRLWFASPATMAWGAAASRAGGLLPHPPWALGLWPAAAVAVLAVHWLLPKSPTLWAEAQTPLP